MADLRDAAVLPASPDAQRLQRTADDVFDSGSAIVLDQSVDTPTWFSMAAFSTSLLRRARRCETGSLHSMLALLDIDVPSLPRVNHGMELEAFPPRERCDLLASTRRLLDVGPCDLKSVLSSAGVTLQRFLGDYRQAPGPFDEIARSLPSNPRKRQPEKKRGAGPRTRREVDAMMARLERRLELKR